MTDKDYWLVMEPTATEFAAKRLSSTDQVHAGEPVVITVVALPGLPGTFHRDAADSAIVARAKGAGLPVLTRDQKIIDSGLIKIWAP